MSSSTAAATLGEVSYEKKGAIAYVTVNRPKVLNALNGGNHPRLASRVRGPRRTTARCAA